MRIIETIMRIIVPERAIKQLSILSARTGLPVDADDSEQAFKFFIDTSQPFLRAMIGSGIAVCTFPFSSGRHRGTAIIENNRETNKLIANNRCNNSV